MLRSFSLWCHQGTAALKIFRSLSAYFGMKSLILHLPLMVDEIEVFSGLGGRGLALHVAHLPAQTAHAAVQAELNDLPSFLFQNYLFTSRIIRAQWMWR